MFCDFVCLKHKRAKDHSDCACWCCRLSVLCYDTPALPFMATHQLRKMFPSEYVFHTCFCKHLHTFFVAPLLLISYTAQCVGATTGLMQLSREKSTGTSTGIQQQTDTTSFYVLATLCGECKTLPCFLFFLTGSWFSGFTDWSLYGWYRWVVIILQWKST